eukprot:m.22800 g.22800  ORF g.22800 m.22800 type:complete len:405 (-) comp7441_c0_seq1:1367-2581(-)
MTEEGKTYGWKVEYAKSGRSKCTTSKEPIPQGAVRIGREIDNPFKAGTTMHVWSLPEPLFASFHKGSASKARITELEQLEGYEDLKQKDKDKIEELIGEEQEFLEELKEADKNTIYLECTTGGESKFWSIAVSGEVTRVKYGAIGEDGCVSEKTHNSEDAAEKFKDKKLQEKLKKGYVQKDNPVGGGVAKRPAPKAEKPAPAKKAKTEDKKGKKKAEPKIEAAAGGGESGEQGWRVEYAKSGRSKCKDSNEPIPAGAIRIGKEVPNPYKAGSMMFVWYIPENLFKSFHKGSAKKARITSLDQIEGINDLKQKDQDKIEEMIGEEQEFVKELEEAEKDTIYLECKTGGENKFWSIAVKDDVTRVRWGAIGDEGNLSEKTHASNDAAEKFKDKKVKEKLNKGYERA